MDNSFGELYLILTKDMAQKRQKIKFSRKVPLFCAKYLQRLNQVTHWTFVNYSCMHQIDSPKTFGKRKGGRGKSSIRWEDKQVGLILFCKIVLFCEYM